MNSLSNAPLMNSSRGRGLDLEVLARSTALGSDKNVPLCKHSDRFAALSAERS